MKHHQLRIFIIGILLVAGSFVGGIWVAPHLNWSKETQEEPSNQHLAFLHEVRLVIQENYWNNLNETDLVTLHVRAIEKLIAEPLGDRIITFQDLDQELLKLLDHYPDDQTRNEFVTQLADIVLANLEPFSRSRLYSRQLEQQLVEQVSNIDPSVDHYQVLEVDASASAQLLEQAYQTKKEILSQSNSEEDQQRLVQVENAYRTLADTQNRSRYDEAGINPTMDWRVIDDKIFYLKIKQFSPTTVQEIVEVTQKVDHYDEQLATLILDIRGNIGGALDGLPYFLGPFIGNNQLAYQMIQQGNTADFKTRTGWLPSLVRYKKMVLLIDSEVQSSAEVFADVIQRYNVGVLVGTPTKGWGTVERVFPLKKQLDNNEEYSVFLVHHLTLRSDGQPIEGQGILPDVDTSQPQWESQLFQYYSDQKLVDTVAKLITDSKPVQE